MCRNILKMGKTYKQRHPRTRAQTDCRNLQLSQTLGLCALTFALFFSILGLPCSCVGICLLNAVAASPQTAAERSSARLANGCGFALSVLMLCMRIMVFICIFQF